MKTKHIIFKFANCKGCGALCVGSEYHTVFCRFINFISIYRILIYWIIFNIAVLMYLYGMVRNELTMFITSSVALLFLYFFQRLITLVVIEKTYQFLVPRCSILDRHKRQGNISIEPFIQLINAINKLDLIGSGFPPYLQIFYYYSQRDYNTALIQIRKKIDKEIRFFGMWFTLFVFVIILAWLYYIFYRI